MRPRDRLALILVALTLAFTTLALGGAPRWAAGVGALLAIATAVPYATSRRTSSHPPVLLFPLAVAAGLTLLQLVPLPIFLAEFVAPSKLQLVRDNAAAWGDDSPTWVVVSFDPPATLVELAKLTGYLALAYTCTRLASIRRARHWLAVIVAGAATLAALITLVHHALGLSALYGLYTPPFKPHILGPLLGVNHLASLLSLAVPVALALAVSSAGLTRLGWLTSAATLAATTLLTGSRGGAVGLLAGLIVTVFVLVLQRRAVPREPERQVPITVLIPAGIVVVCTIVLLAVLSAGDVARDLSRTSLSEVEEPWSKYQLWNRASELVASNRWLGVGNGGFEPAFAPHAETGAVIYSHAENSYLQSVIDWGLPGAALLFLAFFRAAQRGFGRWRQGPHEAGVLGALIGLAVHDIADFSIELPAVAMLALVAASLLFPARLGATTGVDGTRAKVAPRKVVALRTAVLAAAVAIALLANSPVGRDARTDSRRTAEVSDVASRLSLARKSMRRHPGDHVSAGQAAEALFQSQDSRGLPDRRALPLIRRAIAMNPHHPGLHHLAARMLLSSTRPQQAYAEFAAAARWARDVKPIVIDVLVTFPDPGSAARALPADPTQAARILDALRGRDDVAFAYAQRVAEMYPKDSQVQGLLASAALRTGRPEIALPAARAAWDLDQIAVHGILLGRALAAGGDREGAIAALEDAAAQTHTSRLGERCTLLFTLADLQIEALDLEGARLTLSLVGSLGANDRSVLASMHLKLATIEDRLGNRNQAEWERKRALELQPE